MTTPDVPLRLEMTFEVPGTPQQVWDAIATAAGMSAWFIPTDVEEREGGRVVFHMGETDSEGTVKRWDPPAHLVYEEPDWATLMGQEGAEVSPLMTEFVVEAASGGSCVVRVVSSAFGHGAQWEQEFFDEMEKGWTPFFDHLKLYLTHFPGQTATSLSVNAVAPGEVEVAAATMLESLGVEKEGQMVDAHGLTGEVERLEEGRVMLRLGDALPGYLSVFVHGAGPGEVRAAVEGYLFSPDAADYVEREKATWSSWLTSLGAAR